jgi:hypothetical protein
LRGLSNVKPEWKIIVMGLVETDVTEISVIIIIIIIIIIICLDIYL